MTEAKRGARRGARTSAARRSALRRAVLSMGAVLLVLPAMPTAILNGGPFALASAKVVPTLTVADTGPAALPLPADGAVFVRDGSARVPAVRGGRVGPRPLAAVQPKFSAGAIVTSSNLLRPGLALGDDEMRTALAGPMRPSGAVRTAFHRPGDDVRLPSAEAQVQVAALAPAAAQPLSPAKADALQTLAAYAPEAKPGSSSLFDAVLNPTGRDFVPPIGAKDHAWAASVLPASSFTEKEQACLTRGIYFEARGESEKGQAAVAQVILNRVRNPHYPKTICGVVYQNQDWKNRCQFSFACDGIKDVIWNKRAYGTAKRIAGEVTRGQTWLAEVGSATHYHATYVKPRWARTMQKVDKIGLHIFYRTFGGGWR